MSANESVPDKFCDEVRKNFEKQLQTGERRMNSHGKDITDLKVIIAQLTQLQITNTASLEAMEKRIQELESSRSEHDDEDVRSPPKETFLNSPSGQLIIKGTFILAIIIVLAAIGQNVSPDFIAKLFGK